MAAPVAVGNSSSRQQAAGSRSAKQKPAKAAQPSTYVLEDALSDFNTWNTPLSTHKQNLLVLNDLHELVTPSTDYWQLTDEDNNPIVLQDIPPDVRNLNDATGDLIRVEDLEISAPAAFNPAATQEERDDCVGALDFTMHHHLEAVLGDIFEQVKELTIKRGMCFIQVSWLSPQDAQKQNRKFPLRWQPQDLFDCSWHAGADGGVKQMIVYKKLLGHDIPAPDWLSAAGVDDLNIEQDVVEYWDETHHGVLIGGKTAMPLTPHGYLDANGDPWCPFVPCVHKPRRVRTGNVPPLASGVSPRHVIVGTPVAEAIVSTTIAKARVMTKHLHQVDRSGGILVLKAIAEREGGAAVDIDRGYAELEDTPNSKAEWIGPPNLSPIYDGAYNQLQQRLEAGGMAQSIASGQTQSATSGRAVNSMTTVPRSKAESLAISLQQAWSSVMLHSVAIWRTMLNNGAADEVVAQGQPAPTVINTPAAQEFWYGDRIALPLYLGGGVRAIVPAMLEGIQHIRVELQADTRMPDEVEFQQAMAAAQQAKDGNPLVNNDWIREKKLHIDNISQVKDAILMDKAEADPSSPWGAYRQREAIVNAMIGDLPDDQKQVLVAALLQQKFQALMQLASGQVPPTPPQGGGGPPPGQPPMTPQGMPPSPFGAPQGMPPAPPPAPAPAPMANPMMPSPFPQAPGPPGGFGPQPAALIPQMAMPPPVQQFPPPPPMMPPQGAF
jgi:hypothetical protein